MKCKGFFITMDAAMGLLVVLLVISTSITLIELSKQKSAIVLTRQARDVIDYNYLTGTIPTYIKTGTDCVGASNVASMNSYKYVSGVGIQEITTTACE